MSKELLLEDSLVIFNLGNTRKVDDDDESRLALQTTTGMIAKHLGREGTYFEDTNGMV